MERAGENVRAKQEMMRHFVRDTNTTSPEEEREERILVLPPASGPQSIRIELD